METKKCKENSVSLSSCQPVEKEENRNTANLKKYIMWLNKTNSCWLNASMALVAHNKAMERYCGINPDCYISKIISAYNEAVTILNSSDKKMLQNVNLARVILNEIQESVLQFLQPILKYKTGDPESAFCSLLNLLKNLNLKQYFDVQWILVKKCTDCNHSSESKQKKPIITLSRIDTFDPLSPSILYNCLCNRSQQVINLVYISLPPCLIFHFENGAGNKRPPLSFFTQGRTYHLTAIMFLLTSSMSTVNHFVTWVREVSKDKWLDCNDLLADIIYFVHDFPDIPLSDVYMYVYESFDNFDVITDNKIIKIKESDVNIPFIDLSDDTEDTEGECNNSQNTAVESCKEIVKTLDVNLDSFNDNKTLPDLDKYKSLKTPVSIDKNILHENADLDTAIQDLKVMSNNTVHVNIDENCVKATETDKDKVPGKNIEADNNLRTLNMSLDVNRISDSGENAKEMNENKLKSDCSNEIENKNESIAFPSTKKTLNKNIDFITGDRPENSETKSSLPTKKEPSNVCFGALHKKPKTLKSSRLENSIQLKLGNRTVEKKRCMNNSEQVSPSFSAEKNNNEKLVLNSDTEQKIQNRHFLSDAAANSFEPSYFRVSLRKRKCSSHPFFQEEGTDKQASGKISCMSIDDPSFLKSLNHYRKVEQEVDEDPNYFPSETLEKNKQSKKLSTMERNDDITTEKFESCSKSLKRTIAEQELDQDPSYAPSKTPKNMKLKKKAKRNDDSFTENTHNLRNQTKTGKTELKKKSLLKSSSSKEAMPNNSSLSPTTVQQKNPRLSGCFSPQSITVTENSKRKSNKKGMVLKDFKQEYLSHKPGCKCDSADFQETIETVVDYTLAYIFKLAQEAKKSNVQ